MSGPADIEACHERLHRSGWSIGEVGTSQEWVVTGTNGENVIRACGATLADAYRQACEDAAAVGMLSDDLQR
jgi:hypothetical protein